MIKKLVLTAFVLIAGLLSTVSQASLFDSEPQFLPRDQAFVFDFEQRGDKLLLKWQIEDGYYLYRHQLKFNSDAATLGEPAWGFTFPSKWRISWVAILPLPVESG